MSHQNDKEGLCEHCGSDNVAGAEIGYDDLNECTLVECECLDCGYDLKHM